VRFLGKIQAWIQERPLVVTTGRCIIVAVAIALIAWDAWARNMEAIIMAIPAITIWIVPILWEPLHRKGGGGWNEVDGDEPDDPDSPTGDSADRWLRSSSVVRSK
jgi:hypothetical protein